VVHIGQNPAHRNFLVRGAREFVYACRAWRVTRKMQADLVLVSTPSMFLLMLGAINTNPVVLDVRDLTWEYLGDQTPVQRLVKRSLRRIAHMLIAQFDLVLVTNSHERDYIDAIAARTGSPQGARIVSNGISRERFDRLVRIRHQKEKRGQWTILYVGNVGIAQDLTTLLDALRDHPDVAARIVGQGNDLRRVREYASMHDIRNVYFVGGCPWDEVLRHYEECDCLYAQITENFQSAVPSKLYEYLCVGLPIIYAGKGAAVDLATGFSGIEIVEPSYSAALSAAIGKWKSREPEVDHLRNRQMILDNYVREQQVESVSKDLVALASR
jgi:glycosyltransferase involved in cell wall biosynthesis